MPIATSAMKVILANAYGVASTYGALFVADPGGSGTAVGEVTGGSPAYARKPLTWPGGNPNIASATFDVGSGTTVTYGGPCSSISGSTVLDKVAVTSQSFASQGAYTATFTFTES